MESMGVMFAVLLAVALCVMPARPYHIAFVGIDGAGDFTPLYNMASEAVHRGHKVTVFNDATAVKRFSWEGMQFVPTGASGVETKTRPKTRGVKTKSKTEKRRSDRNQTLAISHLAGS